MAKKAKTTGRDGIDRWTSNGYGIKIEKQEKNAEDKKRERSVSNEDFKRFIDKGR